MYGSVTSAEMAIGQGKEELLYTGMDIIYFMPKCLYSSLLTLDIYCPLLDNDPELEWGKKEWPTNSESNSSSKRKFLK